MEEEKKGRIIKGLGGLYDILCEGEIYKCRARGAFRHDNVTPYVGDNVIFREDYILDICERRNYLVRPPIANLDILFIVVAAKKPLPVTATIDKMTAIAEFKNITPVIIVTKNDLDTNSAENLRSIYTAAGFEVFVTDPEKDKTELYDFFVKRCADKLCAFAGASGVGKSTLLNALFPTLELATGDVSKKIARGKHTTRHVQLYPMAQVLGDDSCTGFIADTPGFSMLDPMTVEGFTKEVLPETFREFLPYVGKCKYTKCTHTKEEGCLIVEKAAAGEIPPSRHESYKELYGILKNKHDWEQ